MHTAKIHRRKKGVSDLEAYQIVIVGNRRLIYHGSTPTVPRFPFDRPLGLLLSFLLLSFPSSPPNSHRPGPDVDCMKMNT